MDKKILFNRIKKSPQFVVGGIMVILLIILALLAPVIVPIDKNLNNTAMRLKPPGTVGEEITYLLGTDHLGRDIFSRLLIGSRISIYIAFIATIATAFVGVSLGIIAGYNGGILDSIIMRCTEITMAVPTLTLGVVIMAVFGASIGKLILIMTIAGWVPFARIARNNVMIIKNREFVQASKALGAKSFAIMWKQIFPNITTPLIIQVSSSFGQVILQESTLSYLYLGVQPPDPSWGNMIADCRNYLAIAPWTVIVPGIALMYAVLAFNLLGDGLRDVLDPKQQR